MSRIPLELNDKIAGNAFQDSGVELRFVPTDDEIPSCRYLIRFVNNPRKPGYGTAEHVCFKGRRGF